ncbi:MULTISPECIES: DUF3093 domain-containing protein [unclassified Mycolicibacterium]|uniref:DUF3093 domain-containing protein n=1 Tax=unclassified Mycolicibacterium TaxID=2636767 RepID=UPI0012DCF382|nr:MULTISPECIES: DUF3093 domain-containing protein [unclassified Mycolicibacterium]MUM06064.1 DUF3093 domain-containing protein [Mycolicibacterium sp. CBMA 213]
MDAPTDADAEQIVFHEVGASWWWLLLGPFAGGSIAAMQLWSSHRLDPLVPAVFLVLVTGFLGLQVKAARLHTSVELTPEYLRQGTESVRVADMIGMYPDAKGADVPLWQSCRALGELTGVPRGRTGIGVKLKGDRTAQAWARRHRGLRAQLEALGVRQFGEDDDE